MPEPMITPVRSLVSSSGRPAGVLHGLVGRGHGVEDEVVDLALVLGGHGVVGIERTLDIGPAAAAAIDARHLEGDLAAVLFGIEGGDPAGAGLAGQDALPVVSTPCPRGVRRPRPVTTTRRMGSTPCPAQARGSAQNEAAARVGRTRHRAAVNRPEKGLRINRRLFPR
jgi:hypothetical protein